jgi:hypothetical protein
MRVFRISLREETVAFLAEEAARERRDLRDQAAVIIERALAQAAPGKHAMSGRSLPELQGVAG